MAYSKKERLTIFSCLAVYGLMLWQLPLFPFLRNSLFADAPLTYEAYEFHAQKEFRAPEEFGLANHYDGDPTYTAGRKFPSAYRWGLTLSEDELQQHFVEVYKTSTNLPPSLCFARTVFGKTGDGNLGVIQKQWFLWNEGLQIISSPIGHPDCPEEVSL